MTRGTLRFSEEMYKAHMAKSDRFKVGTDQRLAAPVPPASTPPRVSGVGEAPITLPRSPTFTDAPSDEGLWRGGKVPNATTRAAMTESRSKYRNKPTNGYASIKESKRAFQLKLMQEAGQIRNLREQVSYLLIPKQEGERACSYVADFVYEEWATAALPSGVLEDDWQPVTEDCKGMRTDIYRLKRKLMLLVHQIRIRET